jgi:predicted transposase YbfD/YdcC
MCENNTSLVEALSLIKDPRKPSNGTLHDFREIRVIAVCAMLSDAETLEDIVEWAKIKTDWLRRFLILKNGIPSHDTFLRVFWALDPACFEAIFRRWVGGIVGALDGTIAIDGKTLRGSRNKDVAPIHMVSAFSTSLGLVLGQEKVANKSNEITAIPELMDALYIKGLLVTIDAMGTQRAIAEKIIEKEGDYLLAVKGNQPTLHQQVKDIISDAQRDSQSDVFRRLDTNHGRTVMQMTWAKESGTPIDNAVWPHCKTLGCVLSYRKVNGKAAALESRYYISSRVLSAEELAKSVRAHWAVENQLHWVLDVNFGEDACKVRKDNAPQNLSLLRKMVLSLLRTDKTESVPPKKKKVSLRCKRKQAAWDDDIRMKILGIQPL